MKLLFLHLVGQKYNAVGARDTSMLLLTVKIRTSAITISVMGMLFFIVSDDLHRRMNSHRNRIRLHFKHKCTRSLMRLPLLLEWSWCDSELNQWFYVLSPLPSHQWVSHKSAISHILLYFTLFLSLLVYWFWGLQSYELCFTLLTRPYTLCRTWTDYGLQWTNSVHICHRFTWPIYAPKPISPMDKLCTSALSWKCIRQTTISKSFAEAEHWALSSASNEVVRLHHLLLDVGVFSLRPKPLFADNTSAIQIVNNPVFHVRTNHIEVDCHFIR